MDLLAVAAATAGRHARRPAPILFPAFAPPFDPSDPGGDIHTTLPPEQVIPEGANEDWWKGDAWGVTLPENPPYVPGANTTPINMIMSYFLPKYVQFGTKWVDMILTQHALRGYWQFLLDRPTFDEAGFSVERAMDLIEYVQSWGFYTPYWASGSGDRRGGNWRDTEHLFTPYLDAIERRGLVEKTIYIIGEELDNGCTPGPNGLDDIITQFCGRVNRLGKRPWLHFTANKPSWQGGTLDPIQWWRQWVGMLRGCLWQANAADPAGTMGAHLWDTRKYLGAASLDFRVVAFELRGNEQLYGRATEADGRRTSWEMICCTRNDTPYPAVSGAGNGPGDPSGHWI